MHQVVGDLVRAVAAQADQAIEAEPVVGLDGPRRHVDGLAVGQRHLVRLLAAGAEDGAAQRQDAGDIVQVQHARMVFDQAAKALLDADDLDVEIAHGRLGDAANGRVEPGTIAAAGQDADALDHHRER